MTKAAIYDGIKNKVISDMHGGDELQHIESIKKIYMGFTEKGILPNMEHIEAGAQEKLLSDILDVIDESDNSEVIGEIYSELSQDISRDYLLYLVGKLHFCCKITPNFLEEYTGSSGTAYAGDAQSIIMDGIFSEISHDSFGDKISMESASHVRLFPFI